MSIFQRGDRCRVRLHGHDAWVVADVEVASANGRSLALLVERPLGQLGRGFLWHAGTGMVALLLTELASGQWRDVVTGRLYEVAPSAPGEPA